MEKSLEKKVSKSIVELKDYLFRAGTSPDGVDLERAVEMLQQCKCVSDEDRVEFLDCSLIILSQL